MPTTRPPSRVIAVGASAGGIEALRHLLQALPGGLDAAVCVVVHIPARAPTVLAQILDRAGPLGASTAVDGEPLRAGHVYVAPPDHHLLVRAGHIELGRGPKENGVRPAVDATFRSLAESHGAAGIGVVLSGALDDGSLGAAVLYEAGATLLVQDPEDALVRSMPESAIRADHPWRVLAAPELAAALAELVGADGAIGEDAQVQQRRSDDAVTRRRPDGPASGLTCPECSGALWELEEAGRLTYRCRVGHTYSEDSLVDAQGTTVEAALWAALEVLEERAEFLRKMAARAGAAGDARTRERFERDGGGAEARADLLRRVLLAPPEELLAGEASG